PPAAPIPAAEIPPPTSASPIAPPPPCAPSPSPRERGFFFGVRVAYAFPKGSLTKSDALAGNVSAMVPLWLDAGYRANRQFDLGAYFQWAPAFVADQVCSKDLSCSAYDVRIGIDARWHFKWILGEGRWAGPFDPWVGVGTGYESAVTHVSTVWGATSHENDEGFEYGNLQ